MKVLNVAAASLLVVAGNLVPHTAQAQQTGTHRTELSKNDISIPGWEGCANAAEIGTYIVPKGKPLVAWIK